MPYKIKSTGQKLQSYELAAHFPHVSFAFPLTQDILDVLDLEALPDDPPPEPVTFIPHRATRKQARKALVLAGLFDAVQPAIDAIADPLERQLAQIDWDDAQDYERSDPFLSTMAAALSLDAAALDALFVQADLL